MKSSSWAGSVRAEARRPSPDFIVLSGELVTAPLLFITGETRRRGRPPEPGSERPLESGLGAAVAKIRLIPWNRARVVRASERASGADQMAQSGAERDQLDTPLGEPAQPNGGPLV